MLLHDLGLVLLDTKQFATAIEYLDKAYQFDRENTMFRDDLAAAYVESGTVRLEAGETQAALRLFERSLIVHAENPTAHNGLGIGYLRLGQLEGSVRHFRIAAELDPENAEYGRNLAHVEGQLSGNAAKP